MKRKKKNGISNLLLFLVFLAGLSLLLYPSVSNYINTRNQSRIIASYEKELGVVDGETHAKMIAESRAYNATLLERENPFSLSEEQQQRYEALLDVMGTGIMGYVDIPCIDCRLPIYHGAEEDVLMQAAGHLDWTSLPVGGESTHCVISGHRGLPTAELMTNIDRLRLGDRFYLNVMDQVLEYQVDQIKVVLPDDTTYLQIEEGQDYVTMVTCTPYGINSHRLLVRGTRVLDGKVSLERLILNTEIEEISLIYVLPAAMLLVVLAVAVVLGFRRLFRRRSKES